MIFKQTRKEEEEGNGGQGQWQAGPTMGSECDKAELDWRKAEAAYALRRTLDDGRIMVAVRVPDRQLDTAASDDD